MSAPLFVATLIAPSLSDAHIKAYSHRIADQAGVIKEVVWLKPNHAADIFYTGGGDVLGDLPFDAISQLAEGRRKKILIADMESTIIEQEMLDELAAQIGVGQEVAEITKRAMNGELDFAEALKKRVTLLKGQPEQLLHQAASRMTLMPGAQELVAGMKKAGGKAWLVSGGFTFFVKIIAERLGFDRFFANDLMIHKGLITGEITLPVLGKERKRQLVQKACEEYGVSLKSCVAVGDGANDVPMLQAVSEGGGLGIAYHAKAKVREIIHSQLNHADLSALLYAQNLIGNSAK